MDFEQLYYFKTIVEEKSYTAASYKLNISQSNLSKQIIKLEEELNIRLFNREKRNITLTEYGKIVYEECKEILEKKGAMIERLENKKNHIQMVSFPFFYQYKLEERLNIFKNNHPEFNIELLEIEEYDVEDYLNSDVLFIRGSLDIEKNYYKYNIDQDELVIVIHPEHPLAKEKAVSLNMLQNEFILCMSKYTTIAKLCHKVCLENGVRQVQFGKLHSNLLQVKEKRGILLTVSKSIEGYQLYGMKVIPIQDEIYSDVNLYIHKSSSQFNTLLELTRLF